MWPVQGSQIVDSAKMKWDREIEDVRELKKKGAVRFLR